MTEEKYYIVKAKCGHVGRDKYIPIDFPIKAKSKTEAAAIVRKKARVKKDHKDAVLSVVEVDKTTFDNPSFKSNSTSSVGKQFNINRDCFDTIVKIVSN